MLTGCAENRNFPVQKNDIEIFVIIFTSLFAYFVSFILCSLSVCLILLLLWVFRRGTSCCMCLEMQTEDRMIDVPIIVSDCMPGHKPRSRDNADWQGLK